MQFKSIPITPLNQIEIEFKKNTVHTSMMLCKTKAASPTSQSHPLVRGYEHSGPCLLVSMSSTKWPKTTWMQVVQRLRLRGING